MFIDKIHHMCDEIVISSPVAESDLDTAGVSSSADGICICVVMSCFSGIVPLSSSVLIVALSNGCSSLGRTSTGLIRVLSGESFSGDCLSSSLVAFGLDGASWSVSG